MNQWKIEKIPHGESDLQKITITGKKPGPWVHIQSSVHGAEIMGNKVIHLLIEFLRKNPINGTISIIPHANPYSRQSKAGTYTTGRFCPITGENWNRIYTDITKDSHFIDGLKKNYKSYLRDHDSFKDLIKQTINRLKKSPYGMGRGKLLGLDLQLQAADADIFLDFHTGPTATEYLYVPQRQQQMAKVFPFKHQIIIPNLFDTAGDEAFFSPWVSLEKITQNDFISGESYTVELGSEETIDPENAQTFSEKIISFLSSRGVLQRNESTNTTENIYQLPLENFKTYHCPNSGLIDFKKGPGEKVKAGEVLYTITNLNLLEENSDSKVIQEVKVICDGIVINHSPSANMVQGMDIYQVLEN